mgnify:CR=1 FL=1
MINEDVKAQPGERGGDGGEGEEAEGRRVGPSKHLGHGQPNPPYCQSQLT